MSLWKRHGENASRKKAEAEKSCQAAEVAFGSSVILGSSLLFLRLQ
jgi:hypothetical protein